METPEKESTSRWKTNHNTLKDGAGSREGALKKVHNYGLHWVWLMLEMFDLFNYGELTSSLAGFWSEADNLVAIACTYCKYWQNHSRQCDHKKIYMGNPPNNANWDCNGCNNQWCAPNSKILISIIWRDPVDNPNVKMQAKCVSSKYFLWRRNGLSILSRETEWRFLWRSWRSPHWRQRSWLLLCAWDGVGGTCWTSVGVWILMGGASLGVWMGGNHLTSMGVQIGSSRRHSSNMEGWGSVIILERIQMGVLDVVRIEWCWIMIRVLQVPSSRVLSVGPKW